MNSLILIVSDSMMSGIRDVSNFATWRSRLQGVKALSSGCVPDTYHTTQSPLTRTICRGFDRTSATDGGVA